MVILASWIFNISYLVLLSNVLIWKIDYELLSYFETCIKEIALSSDYNGLSKWLAMNWNFILKCVRSITFYS